jgi:hypothetical protein
MGRIADAVDTEVDLGPRVFTNKVDTVLERLDDDDDRAVVLSWLLSDLGDEEVEQRLLAHDIGCSDSTIRRWRRYQARGMGRQWAA